MVGVVANIADHDTLVEGLLRQPAWAAADARPQVIRTHISTVILVGSEAFKLKKPLSLGFLDYSTLALREEACREEVRLNQRLAPDIYLDAVPVTGSLEQPGIRGQGAVLDWAVRMRRFDPGAVLSERGADLGRGLIERLARRVASFHRDAARLDPLAPFGTPEAVHLPMRENFAHIRSLRSGERAQLDALADWTAAALERLTPLLQRRRAEGWMRECHGDLHLGNVVLIEDEPVVFDGIEFNPGLRWIDCISDLAIMTMDLAHGGRGDLARWFLNAYLQETGDYGGLALLRFYELYRAMVRAKVDAIRAAQTDLSAAGRAQLGAEFKRYLRLAEGFVRPGCRGLIITHGVSGSGKSTLAGLLVPKLPLIHLRSDIERKRIAGMPARPSAAAAPGGGIYSSDWNRATYAHLTELARTVISAGYTALVDATFLRRADREVFRALARELAVPFLILDCDAPEETLRERVRLRQAAGCDPSDADESVLELQLAQREPLDQAERAAALHLHPGNQQELHRVQELLERGGTPCPADAI